MALRREKKRKFDGKVYERAGQTTSHSKASLERWAQFQREVNGNDVRIVEENGGYEAYMRKGSSSNQAGESVTIHTVPKQAAGSRMFKIRRPKAMKVRVPDGDIVTERGRRHLKLY